MSDLDLIRGLFDHLARFAQGQEPLDLYMPTYRAALDRIEANLDAAREAAEELAKRYGATVEWDSEGMPALTMPRSDYAELARLREAVKRATRGHNVRGSDGPCECELCLFTQENPDDE